jgi:hypothetical protein
MFIDVDVGCLFYINISTNINTLSSTPTKIKQTTKIICQILNIIPPVMPGATKGPMEFYPGTLIYISITQYVK